jgi:glycosyltransferase involved in cell wall biosynthesis
MNMIGRFASRVFPQNSSGPVGKIDKVENGELFGWARSDEGPRRWLVDVFVDGVFAGQALANGQRADLAAAGVGDGAHAFRFHLGPLLEGARVEVFALGADRYSLPSSGPPASRPVRKSGWSPVDYLRATFDSFVARTAPPETDAPSRRAGPMTFERLLEPATRPTDGPERPVPRYYELVRHRFGETGVAEPVLSERQYDDLLAWHLGVYAQSRGPLRAPLAARDIARLNAPAPGGGSRAQAMFAADFAGERDETDIDRAFRWCAHDARVLWLEDCLIGEAHIATLASTTGDDDFPLTVFLEAFVARHPMLRALPSATPRERAFLYFVATLFSATAPHYLLFLPARWRAALFSATDGPSLFSTFARSVFPWADAEALRGLLSHALRARDFDVVAGRYATVTESGARGGAAARVAESSGTVDVQLIGPFTRALGIGQSCRRLADALSRTGHRLRFCDYTLDHPNDAISSCGFDLAAPGPARINIVHLNLEEFQAAVAYGPDVFADACNVLFPFLELVPPAPAPAAGLALVDEAWAASTFLRDALSPFVKAVFVGGHCDGEPLMGRAAARALAYDGRAAPDDFVFLTAGDALSGVFRKNPMGAAQAFLRAFPDDPKVRLFIKTHSVDKVHSAKERAVWKALRQLAQEDPRIALIEDFLGNREHFALIEGADAFVSLHRAEGFGYHMLEAMRLGAPVVATAYSGASDFCTTETAYLTPYRLAPVAAEDYPRVSPGQVWAEPDLVIAARQMRLVRDNPALRAAVARKAQKVVGERFSRDVYVRAIDEQIRRILAARP